MSKRKGRKHFVCKWCEQDTQPPVTGRPRVGRTVVICPGCRGPVA
jgi:hypothetical protein